MISKKVERFYKNFYSPDLETWLVHSIAADKRNRWRIVVERVLCNPAIFKYQVGNHPISTSNSFAKYAIVQHLDHKAEDT